MIESFVKQILIELNIGGDPYNEENNCYILPLDNGVAIEIQALEPEGFSLKSSLCSLPIGSCEELLTNIMKGNLFGQGTGGAVLALDPSGKTLTLSLHVPYEIAYGEFKEQLEDFANVLCFWVSEVQQSQVNSKS